MVCPRSLQARETGGRQVVHVPEPSAGILVLEKAHQPLFALPGGVLGQVDCPVHYLDLGGVQAHNLAAFGGPDVLLAGVTKLYACHSGLCCLDGLQRLTSIRWLYLDHNQLEESELLRLPDVLPAGTRLEALDIRGNPGCTPEAEATLEGSSLLSQAEFLNGRRLR